MDDPNELLEAAEATPFLGWDFSVLGERLTLEPPAWDFGEIVIDAARRARTMLDMGTGGGEWLSSLPLRSPRTVATESWQPNVAVAAVRLGALGVPVVFAEGARDNVYQQEADLTGRLPFHSGVFDLVSNRHESFRPDELARVLRPGGVFITQQAQSGTQQFHRLLRREAPQVREFELDAAVSQLRGAGFRIDEAEEGRATTVFADIGALAWYLRSVPWAVPGFTIDGYRDALLRLHGPPIRVSSVRFWLRAHSEPR